MLLAYQVDGGAFYWEIYTANTQTYIATVENDDMGDWIAQHRAEKPHEEIMLYPQEQYQIMFDLHIELDKWFGQPDRHLDDCEAIHDPKVPVDGFYCEGCKAYLKWTEGKYVGDYWKAVMNRKKGYAYV